MAAMKTYCMVWSVASVALGIVGFHGQSRAQPPGCVVTEVAGEDQAAFTQRSPPMADKVGEENGTARQDDAAPLVPLPRPRGKQRSATDQDDAMNISTREKAFASGQSLADYCNLKIKEEPTR
jgi:hypothetical protein